MEYDQKGRGVMLLAEYTYVVFFFKQKTAYEVRISDWSSDVCSSDLPEPCLSRSSPRVAGSRSGTLDADAHHGNRPQAHRSGPPRDRVGNRTAHCRDAGIARWFDAGDPAAQSGTRRSEEHTSELQSLMRISYAVFCLKNKKRTNTT